MEPVSFAVGVIGLAGLFSTCLDAVSRLDSWREYDTDYRVLQAQYNAQKHRLEKWGQFIGIQDQEISDEHHDILDDPKTSARIKELLLGIDLVCRGKDKSLLNFSLGKEKQNSKALLFQRDATRDSKGDKIKWVLGAKAKRTSQVQKFTSMVEDLHNIIPVGEKHGPGDKLKHSNTMRDEISENKEWKQELREILNRIEMEMQDEIRRDIHGWLLGSASSNEIYEMFVEKRIDETCDWVLDRPWFLDWMTSTFPNQRAKILWINGPAGFGKSIICARIAHHLLSQLEDPLGHFFISSDFENHKDPFVAIRTWLSQILHNPVVFALAHEIWSGRPEQKASRGDTLKLFREVVTAVPCCTFVLDGLDECYWSGDGQVFLDGNSIIEFLTALRKAIAGTSTRILIVSRDEPQIRSCLADDDETQEISIYQYKIRPEDVQSDIEAFSRSVVDRKLASRPGAAREDIAQKLAKQCNGQFLWIKMQEDHLRSGKSQKKLEQAINSTPPGLEHTYDRNWKIISRFPEDDRERTISLLRWAAFALRPLSISEVAGALSISQKCDKVQLDELPDAIDEDYISTEILDLCGSLIEVRSSHSECAPGLRTVHLAHFSVREYLLRNLTGQGCALQSSANLIKSVEIMENTLLAKMCLCYVDCEYVWENPPNGPAGKMLASFRDYASGSWHRHARIGNIHEDELVGRINHLFDTQNTSWGPWKRWFDINDGSDVSDDSDDSDSSDDSRTEALLSSSVSILESSSTNPLYYASCLNLIETTQFLLSKMLPVNETGNCGRTPLIAACRRGNLEIVERLIDYGADLAHKHHEDDALSVASFWGRHEVVKLLLRRSPNLAKSEALHRAIVGGEFGVAKLLVESGADLTLRWSLFGDAALHMASHFGRTEMVQLLLSHGADINIRNEFGWTPVNKAANYGNTEVLRLLVEQGADIEIPNKEGQTPICSAARACHESVVRLLIEHGADITTQDHRGWTVVNSASAGGSFEIVQMLLEKDVDIHIPNDEGVTALHSASEIGNSEIVRLLLDHGANVDQSNKLGWTPLMTAIGNIHLEVTKLLVEAGADTNYRCGDGCTTLILATRGRNFEDVKLLLEHGADVTLTGENADTALHWAAARGSLEIAKLLLENGAVTDSKDSGGMTPLMDASKYGHLELVKLLVNKDADFTSVSETGHSDVVKFSVDKSTDITTSDKEGWTALHFACKGGHLPIIEYLLDNGGSIHVTEKEGCSLLHIASRNGHLDVVKYLIKNSADITMSDNEGWTALHYACENGHLQVVEFLLDKGGSINARDIEDFSSLHAACQEGHLDLVKYLVDRGADITMSDSDGWTALHYASHNGHLQVVEFLLDSGGIINARDIDDFSSLHVACREGHLDLVKYLVDRGADITMSDSDGWTALHYASHNGHLQVVEFLLSNGGSINARDIKNLSSLHAACQEGHLDLVKYLIKNGADITTFDNEGWTALHFTCSNGHLPIVELLLESGASVDVADKTGFLPFHQASYQGHIEVVKLLVNALAGRTLDQCPETILDLPDMHNRTPLFYAAMEGHKDVVEFLLSNSSPSIRDRYGATPLCVAVRGGHVDVVKQLITFSKDRSDFEDGLGQNLLWWAAACGQDSMVDVVRQFAQEAGIKVPEPMDGKECALIKKDKLTGLYCTFCTREIDDSYLKCETCEEIDACFQCVGFKVECFDSSHAWKLQEPDRGDSDEAKYGNKDGNGEIEGDQGCADD